MKNHKAAIWTTLILVLAGTYLLTGGGLSARAGERPDTSPFALPEKDSEQGSTGQADSTLSSRSVFRLPDKKQQKSRQQSPFALSETDKPAPAVTQSAPEEPSQAKEPAPAVTQSAPEESSQAEDLFKEATTAAKQGRYEEAGKMYSQLLERDPTNVKAMNNLGLVLKKLGRNEDALQAYSYAIQTDNTYPLTYKNIGILLEQMNDGNGAVQAYRSYIEMAPDAADAAAVQERLNWLSQ